MLIIMAMLSEDERHMEYKDNFKLLQLMLDTHPACRERPPNCSMQTMAENLGYLVAKDAPDIDPILALFRLVHRYVPTPL